MTEDEIINIITKSSFDELKKMRVDSDHISLVDLPDIYGAHQYFTIIDSKKKMDRYFGWHEGEFNGTYYGSPVKRSKEFWTDMQNFPSLTICVGVGTPRNMNISESNILMAINAKDNPKFFNASNSGGAKTKGHKSITALDNIVFNLGKNVYPIVKMSKQTLHAMKPHQVREVPEIPGKVQAILYLIEDSKGRWLSANHKYVLVLEDFYGKGEHLRIGSYHTLKAAMRSNFIGELNAVFIPKKDWKNLDPTEIKDLGHFDNKKDDRVNDSVSLPEAISNAITYMKNNGITDHTDQSIKDKFMRWGFTKAEWDAGIRKSLRTAFTSDKSKNAIPPNHIKKIWTDADKEAVIEKHTDENTHAIILTTAWWSNRWVGFDAFIKHIKDDDALKKPNWKIFWLNESDTAFLDWNKVKTEKDELGNIIPKPTRKTNIEFDLTTLISRFSEEIKPKLIFEDLPYSELNDIQNAKKVS